MKSAERDVIPAEPGTDRAQGKTEFFDLLRQDHERVRALFKTIKNSTSTQITLREEFFGKLEQELLIHMEAEERFFYTALEQHDEARAEVLVGYEEHQVVRIIIGTFNSLAVDDERWPAKLMVLSRLVRQHMDEEEHELFKLAKKLLGSDRCTGIVAKLQEFKRAPKRP